MTDEAFVALLDEKREEIITTIEMVAEDSLLPDFYGIYAIYLDESDGQIYVFMTERDSHFLPKNPSLRYLYEIRSHAVKDGDFTTWLSDKGVPIPENQTETKLIQLYRNEYRQFVAENNGEVFWEIVHADTTFEKILDMYGQIDAA